MEKIVGGGIIFTLGIVGVKIYGSGLFTLLVMIYLCLSILDIFLGWYIAKNNQDVHSSRFIEGVIKKSVGLIIMMIVALISWHISYLTDSYIYGIVALIIPILLVLGEIMSILENYLLLNGNRFENKVVRFIFKMFGLGLDIGLDKIENKVKTFTTKKK